VKTEDQPAAETIGEPHRPLLRRVASWPYLPWGIAGVALGLAILFGIFWQREVARDARENDVRATATAFLTALTNFKGSTIDRDVSEIASFAVGDFAKQVQTFFNQQAKQALTKAEAESIGRVQKVFVEAVNGQSASVFGVVNEAITNSGTRTNRRLEVLRVELEMIDTKDGWKINQVNILQSPTSGPLGGP
jgi:hypothetical protein